MRMALWSGLALGGNATKKSLAPEHRDLQCTSQLMKSSHQCMYWALGLPVVGAADHVAKKFVTSGAEGCAVGAMSAEDSIA